MGKHNLDNLGPEQFERLSQTILQKVIGPGVRVYGMGKDGSREATFSGRANYPSAVEQWDGSWIFQAKFHDVPQIGPKEARRQLLADLDDELSKVVHKYGHGCNNYILMTNVSLTPVFQVGIKDRIDREIVPKYGDSIKHVHVWGAEEIERFIDGNRDIAKRYADFLTPGDIIARLMHMLDEQEGAFDETVRLYCQGCFDHEQYAALDDAGDVEDKRVALQRVFVDLTVMPPKLPQSKQEAERLPEWYKQASGSEERTSALSYLLDDSIKNFVLIGGPGEGKSTLGQYLAQIHRSRLIGRLAELGQEVSSLDSCLPRIPFRVLLRDYAQWTVNSQDSRSLFHYIAQQIAREAGRNPTSEDVQKIMKGNATLLILDGLDEVADKALRRTIVDNITSAVHQIRDVLGSDLRVVATTRPFGYSAEFDPSHYLHVTLNKLSPEHAWSYANRWADAREAIPREAERILATFKGCLADRVVSVLTATPLQVTIVLVIIRARGSPPKQREELFESYMDIIYQREQKKHLSLVRTDKDLIYGIHKYLAYVLHRRAGKNVTGALAEVAEFRRIIEDYVGHANPLCSGEDLSRAVDQIVLEASERLVLIESPREGKIGFGLTVIREFFAAAHLVDSAKDSNEAIQRFKAIAKSAHWRNVALFFAGRLARTRPGEASAIIDVCREIDTAPIDRLLKRGAELVMQIVGDRALTESYSEIGALQYGLTVLDRLGTEGNEASIEVIKGLPDPYQTKVVRPYLEKKLKTVRVEQLGPWSSAYAEVVGPDELWCRALDQLAASDDVGCQFLVLKEAFARGIHREWVIGLLERLPSVLRHGLQVSPQDVRGFLSFQISAEVGAVLCEALCEWLQEHMAHEYSEGFKQEFIDDLFHKRACGPLEKNWLLCWASAFLTTIHFLRSNTRSRFRRVGFELAPVAFADPAVRRHIAEHKAEIERCAAVFGEEQGPLLITIRRILRYLLEPCDKLAYAEACESLTDRPSPTVVRMVAAVLFPWEWSGLQNREQFFEDYERLTGLYPSEEIYIDDLRQLTDILNRKSKSVKSHSDALRLWLYLDFDDDLEAYLDKGIMSELQDWWLERGLTFRSLALFRPFRHREAEGFEFADLVIRLLEGKLSSNKSVPRRLGANFLVGYVWSGEGKEELELKERTLECIKQLGATPETMGRLEPPECESLLWFVLGGGHLSRNDLITCYALARSLKTFPAFPWRVSQTLAGRWDHYVRLLGDQDTNLRRLAGMMLGCRVSYRHFDTKIPVMPESVGEALWNLVEDRADPWRAYYISALRACRLQWTKRQNSFFAAIKQEHAEEAQRAWVLVIGAARFSGRRERDALSQFLMDLLNGAEDLPRMIVEAAFSRLVVVANELEPTEFSERPLNLPLPQRSRLVRL